MKTIVTGLSYLVAGLLGFVTAFLPTLLISWIIFPPDGPIGEGLIIMFIHLISSCFCIPGYVALMALHLKGRRNTRKLIACEIGLRASMVLAASVLCFMAVKLPTRTSMKAIFCLLPLLALVWATNRLSWNPQQSIRHA